MNWDAIGAIAELVGALSVLVTLIYLAFQVRQANVGIQSAVVHSQAELQNAWLASLARSPDLHQLYRKGLRDDDSLSKEDRGRFDLLVLQVLFSLDAQYHKHRLGAIQSAHLGRIVASVRPILSTAGGSASYHRQKEMLSMDFRHYVERVFGDSVGTGTQTRSQVA